MGQHLINSGQIVHNRLCFALTIFSELEHGRDIRLFNIRGFTENSSFQCEVLGYKPAILSAEVKISSNLQASVVFLKKLDYFATASVRLPCGMTSMRASLPCRALASCRACSRVAAGVKKHISARSLGRAETKIR